MQYVIGYFHFFASQMKEMKILKTKILNGDGVVF